MEVAICRHKNLVEWAFGVANGVGKSLNGFTLLSCFVTESVQIFVQIGCKHLVLIGSNASKVSVLGEIMRQGSLLDAPPDFQLISRNKARVISNDATIAEVLFFLQPC